MSEKKIQIDEIGSVAERINMLVDYFCKGNKTAFGRAADIQSGVLAGIVGGRGSKPGFEILQKLLTAYPSVNPTWLLFGRGPMLQGGNAEIPAAAPVELPSKELEEMVRQIVKNQLEQQARRSGFERNYKKRELARKLDSLNSQIEENKSFIGASYVGVKEEKNAEGEWIRTEITDELLTKETQYYKQEAESIKTQLSEYARADEQVRQEMNATVYRLAGEPDFDKPFWGMLRTRLSVPNEVAEKLIISGKIRSVFIEGEGYRVSEQAVREFLGEA